MSAAGSDHASTFGCMVKDAGALVTIVDGQVVADSRDVADAFGRQHFHVLREIRDLLNRRPDLASTFGC